MSTPRTAGPVKTPGPPSATPSAGPGLKAWLRRHKKEALAGGAGAVALVAWWASRHRAGGTPTPFTAGAPTDAGTPPGDTAGQLYQQLQPDLANLQSGQGDLADQVGQLTGAVDQLGAGLPTGGTGRGRRRRPRPAKPAHPHPAGKHRKPHESPKGKLPRRRPRPAKPTAPAPDKRKRRKDPIAGLRKHADKLRRHHHPAQHHHPAHHHQPAHHQPAHHQPAHHQPAPRKAMPQHRTTAHHPAHHPAHDQPAPQRRPTRRRRRRG